MTEVNTVMMANPDNDNPFVRMQLLSWIATAFLWLLIMIITELQFRNKRKVQQFLSTIHSVVVVPLSIIYFWSLLPTKELQNIDWFGAVETNGPNGANSSVSSQNLLGLCIVSFSASYFVLETLVEIFYDYDFKYDNICHGMTMTYLYFVIGVLSMRGHNVLILFLQFEISTLFLNCYYASKEVEPEISQTMYGVPKPKLITIAKTLFVLSFVYVRVYWALQVVPTVSLNILANNVDFTNQPLLSLGAITFVMVGLAGIFLNIYWLFKMLIMISKKKDRETC